MYLWKHEHGRKRSLENHDLDNLQIHPTGTKQIQSIKHMMTSDIYLCLWLCLPVSQRVLEADAAEDAFNDDDDYEVDTPKRRHRGKGRVSEQMDSSCTLAGTPRRSGRPTC